MQPASARLLAPLPLLIDTVLRCVYACPAASTSRAATAAAPPAEGEEARLAGGGGGLGLGVEANPHPNPIRTLTLTTEPNPNQARLGVEEALEMINVMYAALPTRQAALGAREEAEVDDADAEAEAEAEAEVDGGGIADGAPPLPPAPGGGALSALLDQLDDLERHLAAQHNLREYGLLQAHA